MSFLAGLGSGFSTAFNQGMARNEQKRQDMFRVAYNQYVDKKSQYDKEDQEWKKALKTGEVIVSRFPDVPKEAAIQAAKWLRAGFDVEDVERMLSETKFSSIPAVEGPVGPDGTPVAAPVSTDQTMQAMDIGIPDPTVEQQPAAKKDGGLLNNVFGEQGIFKNAGKSPEERAQSQLQEALGIDTEQFENTQRGFIEPDLPSNIQMTAAGGNAASIIRELGIDRGLAEGKLRGIMTTVEAWERSGNPSQQEKARIFKEEILPTIPMKDEGEVGDMTRAQIITATGNLDARSAETIKQKRAAADLGRQAMKLADMAKAEDGAALRATTELSSFIVGSKDEILNVIDQATRLINAEHADTVPSDSYIMKSLNSALEGTEALRSLSENQRNFVAAQIRMIYAAGKALGQQGNGFSNADYENIRRSIQASNNYDSYVNNLKNFVGSIFADVDTALSDERNSLAARQLSRLDPEIGKDIEERFSSLENDFSNQDFWKWLNDAAPEVAAAQGDTIDPNRRITPEDVSQFPDILTEGDIGKAFGEIAQQQSTPEPSQAGTVVDEDLIRKYPKASQVLRQHMGRPYRIENGELVIE